MLGYRVPNPDEAMLISGGKTKNDEAPFRVVTGHGAFVLPWFRKARMLTLAMDEAEVTEHCVTKQGIALNVKAIIAFKVGNDTTSIISAATRFLHDQNQMPVLTGRIFAGHLRSIIGGLTVEEIIRERQRLATEVLDGSKEEMARLGLTVDSLQIQSIDDGDIGYILAMSAPHNATIQQQAKVAQAEADRVSAEAQQESARKQAEYARQTSVVQAQYKAEVDKAQAQAAQAGPLAQAEAQQQVLETQATLAQRQAALRQQQLQTEVVKPAEAEANRVQIAATAEATQTKILAAADAEKTKLLAAADAERVRVMKVAEADGQRAMADAAASNEKVSLDKLLIENMPAIISAAASGLSGANLTVLNGTDGLGQLTAGIVAQGVQFYESLRTSLRAGGNGKADPVNYPRPQGTSVTVAEAELASALKRSGALPQ
jgi:flotillin